MTKLLIIYSSKEGHTLKICQALQTQLEQQAHDVTLAAITEAEQLTLADFDKIVIGASVHYGRHNPQIRAFIKRHQAVLDSKSNAFFSVNLVARKQEKQQIDTNPYLLKFLKRISWQPKLTAVFAGKLDYPRLKPLDRNVIRFIMWLTKGPTHPSAIVEFTDWQAVATFAQTLSQMK